MTQTTPDPAISRAREILESIIAIASESDERSSSIPSTEGQRELSAFAGRFFSERGWSVTSDDNANLIATKKGNPDAPPVSFMVHIDTAQGTAAPPALNCAAAWTGDAIAFPRNERLVVTAEEYDDAKFLVGHDVLFGPGTAPVGFDDKVGMAEMMLLAERIADIPLTNRPTVHLICRPDEEIGRMAAIEGLAVALSDLKVRHGYTLDGFQPFEINTENFNAARVSVTIRPRSLKVAALERAELMVLAIDGVKSHGATAKSEGYLNATRIFLDAIAPLSRRNDVIPMYLRTDAMAETSAEVGVVVRGDDEKALRAAEAAVLNAFSARIDGRDRHGAQIVHASSTAFAGELHDAAMRAFTLLATWARTAKTQPLWSEASADYEGYSNPYAMEPAEDGTLTVHFRVRDFDKAVLQARIADIQAAAATLGDGAEVEVVHQYVNMGDKMGDCPELVTWAEQAGERAGVKTMRRPIRGGTGVDPFLVRGVYVANLGTGYFAPESEKELTSPQAIVAHTEWLVALLDVIAGQPGAK